MTAPRALFALALGIFAWHTPPNAKAVVVRGIGTAALFGGDLTDPENDGAAEANTGYNATFSSSEEPGFGGGEFAFNVFDNLTGGGNNKWCCGDQNNFPTNPISIDATFATPIKLTLFTLTSANDTPDRDPRAFQIQGSNDGINFTTIFSRTDTSTSPWTARDQVLEFDAGADFPVQTASYTTLRFITTATNLTTGARFQLAEIEYVPEPVGLLQVTLASVTVAGSLRRRRA
jgi:hypothetical protein